MRCKLPSCCSDREVVWEGWGELRLDIRAKSRNCLVLTV
jgi:hypothetical protein